MRFLISPREGLNEANAANYNAALQDVWTTEQFYLANEIDRKHGAKRNEDGSLAFGEDGEPIIENKFTIKKAKHPKDWFADNCFDYTEEIIEPAYDPDYKTGGWVVAEGGVGSKSTKFSATGIPHSGGLHCTKKVKKAMYVTKFDDTDLKGFVDYLMKHDFTIDTECYPRYYWFDDNTECLMLYNQANFSDY